MQQFNLLLWLKDKSRKVVTRDGRDVRIICWNAKNSKPIVALVLTRSISQGGFEELKISYFYDGTYYGGAREDFLDLFFADDEPETEPETIEVPFGAKDSEFIKDEYLIPECCEARIEGNKVIIEKIQEEEELTEFEQKLVEILKSEGAPIGDIEKFTDKDKKVFHCYSKQLLDLARKELHPEFDKEMDKMLAETDKVVYQKGHEDALKSLPKFKKATQYKSFDRHILLFEDEERIVLTTEIYKDEYYIELDDLKTLPKEE